MRWGWQGAGGIGNAHRELELAAEGLSCYRGEP